MTASRYSLTTPPKNLCILRLSALGDITHVLPALRSLQTHWPETQITWVIGKSEYQLVRDIEGVEFIIFDKSRGLVAYKDLYQQIRQRLNGHQFDVLLHMQVAIRASIASMMIPARIRLGFDRARARDLQWLFCNHQIEPESTRQHVLDSFLEFIKYFGLPPVVQWQLPVNVQSRHQVENILHAHTENTQPILVINPCAVAKSKNWRDWTCEGYATAADYAAGQLAMHVVLSGGPSDREREVALRISELCQHKPLNLTGQTSIAEMVALLDIADIVISPDTGPAHIASALGTPVIGLYAATNPLRAGPYSCMDSVINAYPQALQHYRQTTPEQASWGQRVHEDGAMAMIRPDLVLDKLRDVHARLKKK